MIGCSRDVVAVSPCCVPEQYRDAAGKRAGEWEINTWDWETEQAEGGFLSFGRRNSAYENGEPVLRKTTIVLKEAEVPKLLHQTIHGIRNKTKAETIQANLEQTAQTLWPNGSLEHIAMRWLAVSMITRVCYGHRTTAPRNPWVGYFLFFVGALAGGVTSLAIAIVNTFPLRDLILLVVSGSLFGGLGAYCLQSRRGRYLRTQMLRRPDTSSGALNHSDDGENSDPKSSDAKVFFIGDTSDDKPDDKPGDSGPKHGGTTPEDADIIASERDRIVDNNGIDLVIGQDYDGKDLDNKQVVGVLTAPTPKKPNVYNNSSSNAKAAKRKRLDEKAKPFTGTPADIKKINKFVGEAVGTKKNRAVFSEKRIQAWAESYLHLEDIKSGKWSLTRLEDSLNNLMKEAYPEMNLKCSVKLEPMEEGKAPRLLIADGDDGQLMALVVVKCFEDLMFDWFEDKSIKHEQKRKAVRRCVKHLSKSGAKLVEGDGSAWDTTCNAKIRSLVENPVLKHIMQVLVPYGVVPEQWHQEHVNCCEKKKLKLFFQKKWDKMRITIDAIRRSGHRGTSCLNWWMNFTNWTCSIFKQPERFLDPTVRKGEDETGRIRWWYGTFEGDDSLCAMFPPMKQNDEMDEIFLGWWNRMGFNMKIVYADSRATFCGYHIACEHGEVSEDSFICPELPRALVSGGVSTSPQIRAAAKAGDVKTVRDIAAASALARAADFAGLLPTVSRKYYEYALSVKQSRDVEDREMSMRVMGKEGYKFNDIVDTIESANLAVTPTEEHANLRAIQCQATREELESFVAYPWTDRKSVV